MSLLQVDNLCVDYGGGAVLADFGFAVQAGETYALVGESGCGKTTALRTIAGLVPARAGAIRFAGRETRTLRARERKLLRREMAMVFQDPLGSLSPRLTIGGIITEPFRIHGLKERDLAAEAARLLKMVNLPPAFAERHPHQLSGGQARRVGVARALALQPKLLLADEPTAGLDVSVQGELLNLLNNLRRDLGLAMVIITHNLGVVRHIADRIGVMYLGRLVEEGATAAVFAKPRHPYTLCLLSAALHADPQTRRRRVALKGEPPGIMHRPAGCEFRARCPFAQDICSQPPPWQAEDGHGVRCLAPLT